MLASGAKPWSKQFQHPDAPRTSGVAVAIPHSAEAEEEVDLASGPHGRPDRYAQANLIKKTDVNKGEVVLLVDCLGGNSQRFVQNHCAPLPARPVIEDVFEA